MSHDDDLNVEIHGFVTFRKDMCQFPGHIEVEIFLEKHSNTKMKALKNKSILIHEEVLASK